MYQADSTTTTEQYTVDQEMQWQSNDTIMTRKSQRKIFEFLTVLCVILNSRVAIAKLGFERKVRHHHVIAHKKIRCHQNIISQPWRIFASSCYYYYYFRPQHYASLLSVCQVGDHMYRF
jgi:hypothetical protein